jgi:MFS family permease
MYLGGCLLSAVGSGVVAPFTAIYLTAARGFPLGTVGLVLAVIAAANIVGSFVGGLLIDRCGLRAVVVVSLAVAAGGWVALGLAATPVPALMAAAFAGLGGGGFYPVSVPILVALAPASARRRAFSLRSLTISLGTGVGAAAGGLLIGTTSVGAFQLMFSVNAASYLVFAVLLVVVLRRVPLAADRPAAGEGGVARLLVWLLVLQTLVVLAGYGQFSASVPLLLQTGLAVDAGLIGALVAISTAVIVLLQLPVGRLSERYRPATMLAALGHVWTLAWGCGLLAAAVPSWRTAALVAMAVLYGTGACLFHPNFQPQLASAVPADRLGRASGYAASAWGLALVIASPAGVLLVGAGPVVLWLVLAALCVAVTVLARRIGRLPAGQDNDLAAVPAGSRR